MYTMKVTDDFGLAFTLLLGIRRIKRNVRFGHEINNWYCLAIFGVIELYMYRLLLCIDFTVTAC